MELTKKDERHIKEQAMKVAWRAEAEASEYAHLYKVKYLETLRDELARRIEITNNVQEIGLKK